MCLFVHGHVLFVCMSVFVCVCLCVCACVVMQYHYNIFESLLGEALQMYCIAVVSFDLSTHCDAFCTSLYYYPFVFLFIRKSVLQ